MRKKEVVQFLVLTTVIVVIETLASVRLYAQSYDLHAPGVASLSCDGRGNPANNVRTYTPVFSWVFSDADAGDAQTRYHLIVGTTVLRNDIWDATATSATTTLMYGAASVPVPAPPLSANRTYYWAVQVRDRGGNDSAFATGTFKILDLGLRVYDGTAKVKIAADTYVSTDPVSDANRLRISKGGQNYSIVLVDPAAYNASKVRVRLPSGTKALGAMVDPLPAIGLSLGNLSFSGVSAGGNPPAQIVAVSNVGERTLSGLTATVSYGSGSGWLTASLGSTTAPATLTVTANPTALPAGTYTATIAVASAVASNSPQSVTVTFVVAPQPKIGLSPGALSFSGVSAGGNPPAQTASVSNLGGGVLSGLTATVSYGSGSGWLTASLGSTTAPATLTVTANPTALPAGTYTATIAVASAVASNSPQSVTVTFVVAPQPKINLSPVSLSFSAFAGGANPAAQPVSVLNGGGGTLSGLGASIIYGDGSGWLSASLGSTTAPATLTVTAATGTLAVGMHTATIDLSSGVASNSPRSLSVTFDVKPVPLKVLTSFGFVSPAVMGTIDEGTHTVAVRVPYGTDVTNLVAAFTTTEAQVRVGSTVQVSGVALNDFRNPVTYTVVAADGSTQDYTVRVTVAPALIAGIVTHLAGTTGGPGSADGSGPAARFYGPMGIASDGSFLYVADSSNNTIRKIRPATGAVTTLTGTAGQLGSTDGVGSAARFYYPQGIAYAGGFLYVADTDNHTIRRIDPTTGAVTTLAGSPRQFGSTDGVGSAALFSFPMGIASDGNVLYVADCINCTIRRIDLTTREVTTLAGSPGQAGSSDGAGSAARFYYPQGITFAGGNLYVGDNYSYTIRKIDPSTGAVTTLAGSAGQAGSIDGTGSAARFSFPRGVASDGSSLYVADSGNSTIRKIDIDTGTVTTLAGSAQQGGSIDGTGPAALFDYPQDIAFAGGLLFVSDTNNNTIRAIDPATRLVTTLAGSAGQAGSTDGAGSEARFYYPYGIAAAGGFVYVADTYNDTIRKITAATGAVTTVAGSAGQAGSTDGAGSAARFWLPWGITCADGSLYVADSGNRTIRRIDLATGDVRTLAGSAGQVGSSDGFGSAARFSFPEGMAFDGSFLYVADGGSQTIRRIDPATGEVMTLAGSAGQAGSTDGTGSNARFNGPTGVACGSSFLYVADNGNATIRRIDLATREVTTLAGSVGQFGSEDGIGSAARFSGALGIASDGSFLYIAEGGSGAIRKIDIATREVTTLAGSVGQIGSEDGTGSAARFNAPTGIASDGSFLYVADRNNHAIRQIR